MRFIIPVELEIVREDGPTPTDSDATEVVRVALQTICNDGYEGDVAINAFKAGPVPEWTVQNVLDQLDGMGLVVTDDELVAEGLRAMQVSLDSPVMAP